MNPEVEVIGKAPRAAVKRFPCVHRVFSLFKRTLLGIYHDSWSRKWAALYCEEFTFRFNRRDARTRGRAPISCGGSSNTPSGGRRGSTP